MDPTTLQLWSVIGTWVAGIGTVAAVITSLWFASHQNNVKLKVSAGHRLLVIPGSENAPDYCFIPVVNIGLRPAKIINISWQVGRGKSKKQLMQTFGFPGLDDIPKTLQEGEEANFMIPFVYAGGNNDWIISFPKTLVGEGSPSLINSLTVCVYTSIGKTFKSNAEKNLIKKLKESYEANKDTGSGAT